MVSIDISIYKLSNEKMIINFIFATLLLLEYLILYSIAEDLD